MTWSEGRLKGALIIKKDWLHGGNEISILGSRLVVCGGSSFSPGVYTVEFRGLLSSKGFSSELDSRSWFCPGDLFISISTHTVLWHCLYLAKITRQNPCIPRCTTAHVTFKLQFPSLLNTTSWSNVGLSVLLRDKSKNQTTKPHDEGPTCSVMSNLSSDIIW